jgi:Putative zinc-finger
MTDMTERSGCGEIRLSLGIYVVGAIDPSERSIVEKHLNQCADCRVELAGLAGLPALLGRVPAADVERLADGAGAPAEPPAELLDSLLRRVDARRRAHKWRAVTAAAAAAVIAIAGGLAGGAAISQAVSTGPPLAVPQAALGAKGYETMHSTDPRTHVTAVVSYLGAKWGTSVKVWVSGVRAGTTCEFWVVDKQGHRLWAAGWNEASHNEGQMYTASMPVSGPKIQSFQVTAAGRVLVTVPAS